MKCQTLLEIQMTYYDKQELKFVRYYCPDCKEFLELARIGIKRSKKRAISTKEWFLIKEKYGNKCAKCGYSGKYTYKMPRLTKDHIIPLSKGGKDVPENIQPLCQACNAKKAANTEESEIDLEVRTILEHLT